MIEEIQDDIIAQLEKITGVITVDSWQGNIEDLLTKPQRLPALYVVYQGALFEAQPSNQPGHAMDFLIVLMGKNLRSRAAGAVSCYALIEAVRTKLSGHRVAGYDLLWPVKEDLILAEGGILVYGLTYRMDNAIWEGEG